MYQSKANFLANLIDIREGMSPAMNKEKKLMLKGFDAILPSAVGK